MRAMNSAGFLEQAHIKGIAAARINSAADLLDDVHAKEPRNVRSSIRPELGANLSNAIRSPRFSRTPGKIQWPGREPGQDTDHVLAEVLGYAPKAIARLRTGNAI